MRSGSPDFGSSLSVALDDAIMVYVSDILDTGDVQSPNKG